MDVTSSVEIAATPVRVFDQDYAKLEALLEA